ncbi:MAG: 3'(2'),5'-bisphosphate nucleotidase CysQ, partial [Bacteroidetes bacterium]|nr:3'(2'),5'-bisphosphate nucleotidase CysQ [Bacteroidota bacterium]
MEWDTGAGHAIVELAGGKLFSYPDKKPHLYNKEDLLNGYFIVLKN